MDIETSIRIEAPAERVWRVLSEVERWPEWTQSRRSVKLMDGDQLTLGGRARIKQPKFPAVTWTITALKPGRSFVWRASSIGYETVGSHAIESSPAGSKVTLTVKQTGLLSHLMPWVSAMSRHYVEMEARGLKQRSEALAHKA